MSCNSCAKTYSLLRKEKGCPGCGFSYCSNCLKHKMYLPKLNAEAKVCIRCKTEKESDSNKIVQPPDAYFKRIENITIGSQQNNTYISNSDPNKYILERLQKLKEDRHQNINSEQEIKERLKKLKNEIKTASKSELQEKLAKLKGIPVNSEASKTILPASDLRSEQEQADDLMKQYLEQSKMEQKYRSEFDQEINLIEARLKTLRGSTTKTAPSTSNVDHNSSDEEQAVKNIIAKCLIEDPVDDKQIESDELPFCEICNEDATLRCLGCRYLFCKRCFLEHKDDDDGCNRYEPYNPKNTN